MGEGFVELPDHSAHCSIAFFCFSKSPQLVNAKAFLPSKFANCINRLADEPNPYSIHEA